MLLNIQQQFNEKNEFLQPQQTNLSGTLMIFQVSTAKKYCQCSKSMIVRNYMQVFLIFFAGLNFSSLLHLLLQSILKSLLTIALLNPKFATICLKIVSSSFRTDPDTFLALLLICSYKKPCYSNKNVKHFRLQKLEKSFENWY